MSIIEKTAIIEDNVIMGENCYIGHFSLIRSNVIIGNNTEIRSHCFIDPYVKIGNNVKILQYSNICQGTIIEDEVFVGIRCLMTNTRRIKHTRTFKLDLTPPYIESYVRIGSGVIILPGVRIGENSLVGAGSVVTKSVPKEEVHIGVPAKFVRFVPLDEQIKKDSIIKV